MPVPHGEVVREVHDQRVGPSFPGRPLGPWDFALPLQHVAGAIAVVDWFGNEAKGVLEAPLLTLLLEAVDHQFVDLLLLSHQPI